MKHWFSGLLLALASSLALAAAPATAPVELSMLLTGTIVIAPDGTVQSHTLDHSEKLTSAITTAIDGAMATWRFVPVEVDGEAVVAKARMNLRLVATPLDDDQFAVRVKAVSFGAHAAPGDGLAYTAAARAMVPEYPADAARSGAGGTVYLMIKVGRDGKVMDAVAQQVNLAARSSAGKMAQLRRAFAKAAVATAKRWTFELPTTAPHANRRWWVAHVPVDYWVAGRGTNPQDHYGQWQAYVPGPVQAVAWETVAPLTSESADAVPSGAVFAADPAIRLLRSAAGS